VNYFLDTPDFIPVHFNLTIDCSSYNKQKWIRKTCQNRYWVSNQKISKADESYIQLQFCTLFP